MPSAAILAGGRASRYGGRDKGALIVGGQTIRTRQLALLSRLTDDILFVSDTPMTDDIGGLARRLIDQFPGRGPLGGVRGIWDQQHSALCLKAMQRVGII